MILLKCLFKMFVKKTRNLSSMTFHSKHVKVFLAGRLELGSGMYQVLALLSRLAMLYPH